MANNLLLRGNKSLIVVCGVVMDRVFTGRLTRTHTEAESDRLQYEVPVVMGLAN